MRFIFKEKKNGKKYHYMIAWGVKKGTKEERRDARKCSFLYLSDFRANSLLARSELLTVVLHHGHGFRVLLAHRILELNDGPLERLGRHPPCDRQSSQCFRIRLQRIHCVLFCLAVVAFDKRLHFTFRRLRHRKPRRHRKHLQNPLVLEQGEHVFKATEEDGNLLRDLEDERDARARSAAPPFRFGPIGSSMIVHQMQKWRGGCVSAIGTRESDGQDKARHSSTRQTRREKRTTTNRAQDTP